MSFVDCIAVRHLFTILIWLFRRRRVPQQTWVSVQNVEKRHAYWR